MAQDNTIPLGKPGIASFESESWGNAGELLYGDTPQIVTTEKVVTSAGALDLPLGAVVAITEAGAITRAVSTAGVSDATDILAAPIVMGAGQTMSVPVYRAGHFRQQALSFDASYSTDALKQSALAETAPMILISKAKYTDDTFPA